MGGVETMTVTEYQAMSQKQKRFYRLYRSPAFLLAFGTPFFIIVLQRLAITEPFIPSEYKPKIKGAWKSVLRLNLALLVVYGSAASLIGLSTLAIIYLPILIITSWIGGWLFYIQHQFEDTHWEKKEQWSYNEAALMGSSYYALPPILQWFTGNIGLHHIHHLDAMIPNYRLQDCLDGNADLAQINRIGFIESLKTLDLALWDEKARKLISFADLKAQPVAA